MKDSKSSTPADSLTLTRRLGQILALALFSSVVTPGILSAQSAPPAQSPAISAEEANQRGIAALERKDYANALRWFRKAAEQGYAPAQASLGMMYRKGWGVPVNAAAAVGWFTKAASQGDVTAQFILASMYHDGEGVARDYKAAMMWALKASEGGFLPANVLIATMYLAGEGVEPDAKIAIAWLDKAGKKPEAAGAPQSAQVLRPDHTLWCDMPTLNGRIVKSLMSIDTRSKYVKFEMELQGTLEYRDGFYGNVITSGYMAADAGKVQQFVAVSGNLVRFGFKGTQGLVEETIDLHSGILRAAGRITQCTAASSGG